MKQFSSIGGRRSFLLGSAALGSGLAGSTLGLGAFSSIASAESSLAPASVSNGEPFEISLAQWSLHRMIRSGKLDALDFAAFTRKTFGLGAIEYVNQFFKDKAGDFAYLGELKQRAADVDVQSLLIMVDGEGNLGDSDDTKRRKAIENHFRWIAAAAFLGCHSIRVNAAGDGEPGDIQKRAADSLRHLANFAGPYGLNIIVENHGGHSSNGAWLAGVMKLADHERVGTLPDFGNFNLGGGKSYDRYLGVEEMMPYAKAVSAKSHDFDDEGNEVHTDYLRMLKLVQTAGYRGFVGIEYEGSAHTEVEGIQLTKALLERVRAQL